MKIFKWEKILVVVKAHLNPFTQLEIFFVFVTLTFKRRGRKTEKTKLIKHKCNMKDSES